MKMRLSLLCVTLTLGIVITHGEKTIDEVIRAAYESSTAVFDDNTVLVDMDMLYEKDHYEALMSGKDSMKGIRGERYRWTNRVVPYVIDTSVFNSQHAAVMRKSMDEWERYTCIRIQPWRGERNYVRISDNNSGCNSYVGMLGVGMQPMNLNRNGCVYHGTVVHEFGHAIGMQHEHQRPERDSYVSINFANVGDKWKFAFNKFPAHTIDNRGVAYDYRSIMHYGKTAFTRNGQVTIITRNRAFQDVIGQNVGLAFSDIKLGNLLYNCNAHCPRKACSDGGFVGKDCKCWCESSSVNERVCECGSRACKVCENNHQSCEYWASVGECQKNPNYMFVNCRKACGRCS